MLNWSRFTAVLIARNREFFRDKASLSWNLLFPFLLIFGLSFAFSGGNQSQLKVGISGVDSPPEIFSNVQYIDYVVYKDIVKAESKVNYHQIDMLIDWKTKSYLVSDSSPKGYIAEQVFQSQLNGYTKRSITGREIRYVDWVVPGILGMNIMFSCLFGVGYVIVRYRKSGVLKRLNATPLSPLEFVLAQVVSRLTIVVLIASIIFFATWQLIDFLVLGSLFNLFLILVLGALSLISLGLLVASRTASEELTGGLLNLFSWPMMILSGVWFSLEGAPDWIQHVAQIFPLTHLVTAARAVMVDGATLSEIQSHLFILLLMTLVFLSLSSWLFNWGKER